MADPGEKYRFPAFFFQYFKKASYGFGRNVQTVEIVAAESAPVPDRNPFAGLEQSLEGVFGNKLSFYSPGCDAVQNANVVPAGILMERKIQIIGVDFRNRSIGKPDAISGHHRAVGFHRAVLEIAVLNVKVQELIQGDFSKALILKIPIALFRNFPKSLQKNLPVQHHSLLPNLPQGYLRNCSHTPIPGFGPVFGLCGTGRYSVGGTALTCRFRTPLRIPVDV